MHLKSDNVEAMIGDVIDGIIEKRFNSVKNRYQNNLQSMRGNEFVFNYIQLLYHKCHEINLNYDGSYKDWIKTKKQK